LLDFTGKLADEIRHKLFLSRGTHQYSLCPIAVIPVITAAVPSTKQKAPIGVGHGQAHLMEVILPSLLNVPEKLLLFWLA
jgi:hypothetical protein